MLCVSLCLGFSISCTTSDNSQSESLVESQSDGLSDSEQEKEEQKSSIYSLSALYEAGKLTQEDLLNIAYYSSNAQYNIELMGEDFVPTVDATLTPELESELKETIVNVYKSRKINPWESAEPEMFEIDYYCGYYGGYHIMKYDNGRDGFYQDSTVTFFEIGGVIFGFMLTYHDTHIEGISFSKEESGVLEVCGDNSVPINTVDLAPLFDFCDSFDGVDALKDFFVGNGEKSYILPYFNNPEHVSVQSQNIKLCYNKDVSSYDYIEKIKYSYSLALLVDIYDSELNKYIQAANLSVLFASKGASYKYDGGAIVYEKYKYVDSLCPMYNYVVALYAKCNGVYLAIAEIYYYAEQDIPLEYFEELFASCKFEWVQA